LILAPSAPAPAASAAGSPCAARTWAHEAGASGLAAALNLGFVAIEFSAGHWVGSAALRADAGHNLIDGLGLLASGAALWLGRLPPTPKFTYGLKTASSLAALANAGALAVIVVLVAIDGFGRLSAPQPSAGAVVMAIALIGALVNGGCAAIVADGREKDLNRRAAFLHMLADMMVSAAVALSGLIGLLTGWLWVDPLCSLGLSLFLAYAAARLLSEALHLALAGVPPHIDPSEVRSFLADLPGVVDVHDLHIWPVGTADVELTCHLVMPNGHPRDAFIAGAGSRLNSVFGIAYATLQVDISDGPIGVLVAA